jgi:phosphomevalonate kinase
MLVALAGPRKSGKTAFAELVVGINDGFKSIAFADALKFDFSEEFGVALGDLYDVEVKERYRQAMVEYGDYRRAKDQYCFCKTLFARLEVGESYIIDDMRRIEELEWVMKAGGKPFRMYSPPEIRKARGWVFDPKVDNHPTEVELDLSRETFEHLGGGYIYNTSNNLDTLERTAFTFLSEILNL